MKLKLKNRFFKIKYAPFILMILLLSMAVPSHAKNHSARLKECLQTDIMYYSCSIDKLNSAFKTNKDSFKKEYGGQYIVLSGNSIKEIAKNKKEMVIVDDKDNKCTIDTSDSGVKQLVDGLALDEKVNVYGILKLTGLKKDSYVIEAKEIVTNSKARFDAGSYVFFPEDAFKGTLIDDLNLAKTVKYYIPSDWTKKYVQSSLTNNGVKGYQYYLNAISPDTPDEFPEIFSIFFFDYERYLEKVPTNPTDGDKKDIEEAIVRNILVNDDTKFKISIDTIKDENGSKMDYYSTTHRASDKNDYRLEFLFKPGEKGITCMLYVYFPAEAAVKHLRDVAYLIKTMSVE